MSDFQLHYDFWDEFFDCLAAHAAGRDSSIWGGSSLKFGVFSQKH